jgi:hypothetical protein
MEIYFLWAGMALSLFSLWALARFDWLRLTRPSRRVMGRVTGHRSGWDDGSKNYAAIYSFSDERGVHEVIDAVYSGSPRPPVGTLRELSYPEGHPELARPPRLAMWLAVYITLLAMGGMLFAKWKGWLQ